MPLNHIIAHRIQRELPTTPANITAREHAWVINGRTEECFRELKRCVLKRIGKDYGQFSEDRANHPLASWINEYHDEKISFESLTKKAIQHFKSELDKTEVLLDGFMVFAYEKLEASDFMHIFFVQHNTGHFIDSNVEITESLYLDTEDTRLSAKINVSDWLSGDTHKAANAVTFLRWRGEKELTDAFSAFIGFAEKVDLSAETEAFLDTVSDYTKDLPEEIAHYTKKQVVNYCLEQDKIGKPVIMTELSNQLKENPPSHKNTEDASSEAPTRPSAEFADFVAQKKPTSNPKLIPDKSQLRQFVRISGRNEQLSMSFASSCLGDTVIYDPESDNLTIKNIPKSLKTRLAKHFQQK